jgi:hypothetical protein
MNIHVQCCLGNLGEELLGSMVTLWLTFLFCWTFLFFEVRSCCDAQASLKLVISNDSPVWASRVAGPTGAHHHMWLCFTFWGTMRLFSKVDALYFIFVVLGIEPSVSCMLEKHSATDLYPPPGCYHFMSPSAVYEMGSNFLSFC